MLWRICPRGIDRRGGKRGTRSAAGRLLATTSDFVAVQYSKLLSYHLNCGSRISSYYMEDSERLFTILEHTHICIPTALNLHPRSTGVTAVAEWLVQFTGHLSHGQPHNQTVLELQSCCVQISLVSRFNQDFSSTQPF